MRTFARLLSAVCALGMLAAAPGSPEWLRSATTGSAEGRTPGRQEPAGQTPQTPAPQAPAPQTPAPPPPTTPAPNADTQQPPRIRTGINYVSVDVIVTDKDGQPVLDLKQDDFAVAEDGKP